MDVRPGIGVETFPHRFGELREGITGKHVHVLRLEVLGGRQLCGIHTR
jgi:hypothetical protein